MADNAVLNAGSGGVTLSLDDIAGVHVQRVKVQHGGDGSATDVSTSSGLPVQKQGTWTLDANSGVDVGDVTVNNAAAAPVPVRLSDGSASLDLAALDLDSGAGTVTRIAVGIAAAASGGPVAVEGTAANGLEVDVTRVQGTVTVDGSGVTQPVSGTVTANAGTNLNTSALALETTLGSVKTAVELLDDTVATDGAAAPTKGLMLAGTDGTNAQTVKVDTGGELQVDVLTLPALVAGTANIGDVDVLTLPALPAGTNNIGDVDVLTLPALPAGTNNIGDVDVLTLPALATGDNTVGRVKLTDGTDVADVLDLTNSNPLTVAIVDGAGTQITSFGGGTQYTEADTDASITGTAMLWEDSADTLRAVSSAKPLPVNIISGAGSGGTAIQDGAVFTPDTTNLTPIGGYRDDATPATVTEGDAASARITEYRALHVNLRDASGTEVSVGGGTQYTEDAAAVADPVGTALMMVRDDALSGQTTADGDNVAARGTDKGELYVKHVDAVPASQSGTWNVTNVSGTVSLPTGASTLAEQQTQTTSLQLLDDVVRAEDEASGDGHKGVVMLARRTATPANTSGADLDYEVPQMSAGRLWTSTTVDAALPAGTNAIGKLAANSGVDIGDVDITSIAAGDNNIGNVDVVTLPATPAGTNLIGRVSASDETSTIYQGTTARTPAFAIIDAATSGDNTLLAAQGSGNIIRVHQLYLVAAGTVNVRFESGASGTALSGQMNLVANTGFVLPYSPIGWFQTAANTLLNLELSAAVSVDGGFVYTVVT